MNAPDPRRLLDLASGAALSHRPLRSVHLPLARLPWISNMVALSILLASCQSLSGSFPEVSRPVTEPRSQGQVLIHDRSNKSYGANWGAVVEMPPGPPAAAPADPQDVVVEANVVLVKRGTVLLGGPPYTLRIEGTLEGAASPASYTFEYRYVGAAIAGRISPLEGPQNLDLGPLDLDRREPDEPLPLKIQEGALSSKKFSVSLTRGVPYQPDPFVRWTAGLLLAPFSELVLFLDPIPPGTVSPGIGMTWAHQRFQVVGEDGEVWGELEGDAYRVFQTEGAPSSPEVIRLLSLVRLERWILETLPSSGPPSQRNVRYLRP